MSSQTARPGALPVARLVGLDLFRAVAVFGMLVAHVGPAAWTPGEGFGTVHGEWEIFHSRMPAMFAFAAGISLNLGGGRNGNDVHPAVVPTLIRASLLALCGVGLTLLGTPVAVILVSFAIWFVLVLPFRRLGSRSLCVIAGVWAGAGPLLSFLVRRSFELPDDVLWNLLVSGDYPALTWMPFVLSGLAVGRMDLSSTRVRGGLAVVGAALIGIGYALPAILLARGGAAAIMAGLTPMEGRDAAQQFARRFFRESGVTDTGSWLWLVAPAPHSGSWADVIGCLGVCALLLAGLLALGDMTSESAGRAGYLVRSLERLRSVVAPLGAMVLSVYAAHIAVMAGVTAITGHSFRGAQSICTLAAFTLGLLLFSGLWMRRFRRGPLESLLGRGSAVIERTGRRVSGGSSHR